MNRSGLRILLLDDEPFMLRLLAQMLAGLGFDSVLSCDNGASALGWVDDPVGAPNLILLDLNMPQMDGIEFVRRLVEHRYTGSLILVSGEDARALQMAERLVRAHQITILGNLRKPVPRDELLAMLEKWRPTEHARSVATKGYDASELQAAIANGELVNYYQPKVALATGDVAGVETLVRWRHPEDGLVFPDQFIALAEAHGLIDELTRVVITAAFAQATAWRDAGLRLRVAVNVSMANLASVAFADFVAGAALTAGVAPQDVVLEVTESQLMRDQRASLESLARLRLKRFRLSIDDFGTGHSSLTQLNDIPFDELKIDYSFVHGAWRDETARTMFNTSLALGEQLGMEVVAEGVEDLDDWNLVRDSGCDLAQGNFIVPAMPAAALPDWIASWRERSRELAATPAFP